MSSKFQGEFVLTVENDEVEHGDWHGSMEVPDEASDSANFALYSNLRPHLTEPFREIGEHYEYTVCGWVNACRPITLIEPFTYFQGGGEWSAGYRMSAAIRGTVDDLIQDEHFKNGEVKIISEVGFWSESLQLIAEQQSYFSLTGDGAVAVPQDWTVSSSRRLDGIGVLKFKIVAGTDDSGKLVAKHSFIRVVSKDKMNLWEARNIARFLLSTIDFLSGKPNGNFKASVLGRRERDSSMRLSCRKRGEADKWPGALKFRPSDPLTDLPSTIARAWNEKDLQGRVNAVNTLSSRKLGFMERFSRSVAFAEQLLNSRFAEEDVKASQENYKAMIADYQNFIQSGGPELVTFAKNYARPTYPKANGFRELLRLALDECREAGLVADADYEHEIVQLRNDIFHGDERGGNEWLQRVQLATEVSIAIIELLTAKDLGLVPRKNFIPRPDTLAYQRGVYG